VTYKELAQRQGNLEKINARDHRRLLQAHHALRQMGAQEGADLLDQLGEIRSRLERVVSLGQELHALAADSPDQRTLEAAAVAICRTALHESEPMQEQKIHAESTGSDDIPF
jgi:hypothetical protein